MVSLQFINQTPAAREFKIAEEHELYSQGFSEMGTMIASPVGKRCVLREAVCEISGAITRRIGFL